ncbi:MAG: hypothetical protein AB1635_07320 [Acidobacteriota bacterium]
MCPLCLTGDDAALLTGLRAGALVLGAVAAIVIGVIVRFAWRLWRAETGASA